MSPERRFGLGFISLFGTGIGEKLANGRDVHLPDASHVGDASQATQLHLIEDPVAGRRAHWADEAFRLPAPDAGGAAPDDAGGITDAVEDAISRLVNYHLCTNLLPFQ
jgi:hypothetical protein